MKIPRQLPLFIIIFMALASVTHAALTSMQQIEVNATRLKSPKNIS
jgi:hypothetical protein